MVRALRSILFLFGASVSRVPEIWDLNQNAQNAANPTCARGRE